MATTIKNIFILGTAIIFMMLFWVIWEIWKADSILREISDPSNSTNRGFEEAEKSYSSGEFRFKAYDLGVPGISNRDLETVYREYRPYNTWNCVVYSDQGFEQLALKINSHSYNEYYVNAYNQRLKTLLESDNSALQSNLPRTIDAIIE